MNLSAVDERLRSKNYPIGAKVISAFLNWPESRVSYSLERLNLERSGMVNRQAIKKEPAVIGGDRFWQIDENLLTSVCKFNDSWRACGVCLAFCRDAVC